MDTWTDFCKGTDPPFPERIDSIKSGQNMVGFLTNINMFSRMLADDEMREVRYSKGLHDVNLLQITLCKKYMEGDLISWEQSKYSIVGNVSLIENDLKYQEICKPVKPWQKLFTTTLSAMQAKSLCGKLYATHSVVSNEEQDRKYTIFMNNTFKTNPEVEDMCSYVNEGSQYGPAFVLAQHKEKGSLEESPLRNPYSGEVVDYFKWYDGWPNGNFIDKGSYWNVYIYNNGDSRYIHRWNNEPFCFTCEGLDPVLPIVRLRGLCKESQFDKKYIYAQNSDDILFYQGDRHTNITFNKELQQWVMVSNRKSPKDFKTDVPVKGFSSVRNTEDN